MIATFAIVASAVVGVAQVAQGTPTGFYRDGLTPVVSQVPRDDLLSRADGSFANPNLLATHVLLLAPLAVAFALTAVAREVKVTLWGLAALAYLGMIMTFSRAGIGAALLSGAVVAYATRPAWRLRIRQVAVGFVVLILLGIVVTGGDLVGGFGRPEAWKLSVQVWKDNPLTGVGLGRAGDALNAKGGAAISYRHAHNLWLTWLVEAGPVAFAAWIWITGWLLWRGWRAAVRGRTLAAASLAGVVGFFAFSMLDHPSNTERIATAFWFVAALIAAGVRPPEGPWRLRRPAFLGVLALLPVLLLAGCGADDEPSTDASSTTGAGSQSIPDKTITQPPTTESTATDTTDTKPATTHDTTETPPPATTSPEDQPGGAGDEEPVGIDADFTGKGGKVTPAVVQVPPFIAISVTLKSGDGATYKISFGGKTIEAGGGSTAHLKLDGLHQNGSYVGTVARAARCGSKRTQSLVPSNSAHHRRPVHLPFPSTSQPAKEVSLPAHATSHRAGRLPADERSGPAGGRRSRRGEPAQLQGALLALGAAALGRPGHRLHAGPDRLARAHSRRRSATSACTASRRSSSASSAWPPSSAR